MRFLLLRLALIALFIAFMVDFWYGRAVMSLEHLVSAEKRDVAAQSAASPEPSRTTEQIDTTIILSRNIFKAALEGGAQPAAEQGLDLDALAETTMKLVLLGTVFGSQKDARAIIRDEANKKEDIFQIGSSVQGALITRIERGRVVLEVDGREEVLNIKDPEGGGSSGSASPVGSAPPGVFPSVPTPQSEEGQVKPEGGQDVVDDRKVPEALPRRRINFRNAIPPPISGPAAVDSAKSEGEEPPMDVTNLQPGPEAEQQRNDSVSDNAPENVVPSEKALPND